jgi:hypothetical protein
MVKPMSEPQDKKPKGGSRTDGPKASNLQRALQQPFSVIRGNRTRGSAAAAAAEPVSPEEGSPETSEQQPVSATPTSTLLQLWALLNQRHRWSSLVVVPSHSGGSAAQVASTILEVGSKQPTPIHLLDVEGLELGAAPHVVNEMLAYVEQGDRVVVLLDSVLSNPVGLEVALAAERALLCVSLGTSDFASARRTLELIGKERFLGSVTLQSSSGASKK